MPHTHVKMSKFAALILLSVFISMVPCFAVSNDPPTIHICPGSSSCDSNTCRMMVPASDGNTSSNAIRCKDSITESLLKEQIQMMHLIKEDIQALQTKPSNSRCEADLDSARAHLQTMTEMWKLHSAQFQQAKAALGTTKQQLMTSQNMLQNTTQELMTTQKSLKNATQKLMISQIELIKAKADLSTINTNYNSLEARYNRLVRKNGRLKAKLITTSATVAILTSTVTTAIVSCPKGWESFAGKCYSYRAIKTRWHNAQNYCQSHEANLVSIESRQEQDFVYNLAIMKGKQGPGQRTNWLWAGGNVLNPKRKWVWVGLSTTIDAPTFWDNSEPSGNGESCMLLKFSRKVRARWHDARCRQTHPYICESV